MIALYTNKNTNEVFGESGLKRYLKLSTPLSVIEEEELKNGHTIEDIRSNFCRIGKKNLNKTLDK